MNDEVESHTKLKQRQSQSEIDSRASALRRKQIQSYERFIAPLFRFWDEGLAMLPHVRNVIPESDKSNFDKLVKNFRTSGSELSVFLKNIRLQLVKNK